VFVKLLNFEGGRGDDQIVPGEGADEVYSGAGNDCIYARDTASFDYIT
jgi:Ca2+-binding RTX toxin-like protein